MENHRYASFPTHRLGIGNLRNPRPPESQERQRPDLLPVRQKAESASDRASPAPLNANGQTDFVDLAAAFIFSSRRLSTAFAHGVAGVESIPAPIAIPDPMPAPSRAAVVRIG